MKPGPAAKLRLPKVARHFTPFAASCNHENAEICAAFRGAPLSATPIRGADAAYGACRDVRFARPYMRHTAAYHPDPRLSPAAIRRDDPRPRNGARVNVANPSPSPTGRVPRKRRVGPKNQQRSSNPIFVTTQPGTGAPSRRGVRCVIRGRRARIRGLHPRLRARAPSRRSVR